jgi:hypothetical protein
MLLPDLRMLSFTSFYLHSAEKSSKFGVSRSLWDLRLCNLMSPDIKVAAIVAAGLCVLYLAVLLIIHLTDRRTDQQKRTDREKAMRDLDEALKAKDDLNEPARWVP